MVGLSVADAMDLAAKRGAEAGRAAGSWVIDGNTSEDRARAILQGYEEGDPEVMDIQPAPLSGEHAGESIRELLGDLLDEDIDVEQSDLLDTYEGAFHESYWDEVTTHARYVLGEEETRG